MTEQIKKIKSHIIETLNEINEAKTALGIVLYLKYKTTMISIYDDLTSSTEVNEDNYIKTNAIGFTINEEDEDEDEEE